MTPQLRYINSSFNSLNSARVGRCAELVVRKERLPLVFLIILLECLQEFPTSTTLCNPREKNPVGLKRHVAVAT